MPSRLKLTLLVAGLAAAGAGLLFSGLVRADPEGHTVVGGWRSAKPARLLAPGRHWVPPLLREVQRYPTEIRLDWSEEAPDLTTPEGIRLRASAQVHGRLEGPDAPDFHETLGPAWREVLRAETAEQVRTAVDEIADPVGAGAEELRERVRQRLLGVLQLAGLRDVEVDLDLTVWQQIDRRAEVRGRILLIGMDGLDWRVAEPLMEAGRMPHLSALVERGARGRLRTIAPVLSPVIWTSMATGVEPHLHGILDFVTTDEEGRTVPVTSDLRRVPALWNIASAAGATVGVVAWWATWPAEQVNGVLVSDRLAYTLFGLDREEGPPETRIAWPPALMAELEPLVVDPTDVTVREISRYVHLPGGRFPENPDDLERIDEMRRSLAATRTYEGVALHLLRTRSPQLFAVYFEGPDVMSHLFMPFRPPRSEWVSEERYRLYRDAVDETYEHHDEILGRLLDAVDLDETTVVLVSDHGFRTDQHRPAADARIGHGEAATWHRKYGVVAMAGPDIAPGAQIREAGILDIPPTLLALMGLPVARDWPGRILEEALRPGFLEDEPVARVASYGRRAEGTPSDEGPRDAGVDAAMMEKLAALGYISTAESEPSDERPSSPAGETAQSLNNKGSALMSAGRLEEAEQALREAVELEPGFLVARTNLGIVLALQGRLDEAEEELLAVHRREPGRAVVMNKLGEIARSEARLDEAERWFREALGADPSHTQTLNNLAILLEERGELEEAESLYRRSVEIDPDFPLGWNNLGNLAKTTGRRDLARRMYRKAIEADPTFIGSYNNLGLLLQEEGELEEAVELYREALDRIPGHPEVRNNLASLYHQMGRYDDAVAEYRRLIEEVPSFAEAYNNLGVLLGEMGDRQAEIDSYRRALEVRPDYVDALHNLGLALLRRGELEEAREVLGRAVELAPDSSGVYRNLIIAELRGGRPQEALAVARRAVERGLGDPDLHSLHGWVSHEAGRVEEACLAMRRSLDLSPDQPEVLETMESWGCR